VYALSRRSEVCLTVRREIDRVRDENGALEDEPRHPDLASGKPWPILVPDLDAEDGS
jgi:hypothetical protein